MSRRILGLEIRAHAVAAVLLESGFKGNVLEAQGYFPISESSQEDADGLLAALQTAVDTLKPAGATCVLGIPTTAVSFRNISVPFHDLKKIRQILPFELEPTLPTPVDELIFDFVAVKNDGHQDLLAFAVNKSEIQRYVDLLDAVHLRPAVIMPGGYAVVRFITARAPGHDESLFIDTGEGLHTIYAVSAGQVRMVRSLPATERGPSPLKDLETTLARTFTALKENQGIAVQPTVSYAMGPETERFAAGNGTPTILGIPLKPIDTVRSLSELKGVQPTPEWSSGRLDIALALALVEIESVGSVNFSTERSRFQRFWGEYRGNVILSAVILGLTLAAVMAAQIVAVQIKQQQLAALDGRIEAVFRETFPDIARVVNPLQQMQIEINRMNDDGLPEVSTTQVRVIDILNALSRQVPSSADVTVNRMVVGTDNVVLAGTTDTFNTVDDMKARLEQADIFKTVTISSADMEKSGKRVRFKLKLEF